MRDGWLAAASPSVPCATHTRQLWYQPIGYRWAHNLKPYAAVEPERFVAEFESMAGGSAVMLSSAAPRVD
jgi:hypothetical protein